MSRLTGEKRRRKLVQLYLDHGGRCSRCNISVGIAFHLLPLGWIEENTHLVSPCGGFELAIATIEHVRPRCVGGGHDMSNLTLYCVGCNRRTSPAYFLNAKKRRKVPSSVGPSKPDLRRLRDSIRLRPPGEGR